MTINVSDAPKVNIHGIQTAKAVGGGGASWLTLTTREGAEATLFVPDHVARLAAETINRAMQAKPKGDGSFTYATDAGVWLIFPGNNVTRGVWSFQHDDAEPGDPRHGTGRDLFHCMDEIDFMTVELSNEAAA